MSVGWSFVLDFTNCITLFSLVSFLLVIICHLYHMLVYDFIEKKKNKISWIQLISRNVVFKGFGRVLKRSPYCTLHKKWSFALKISAKMWPNPQFPRIWSRLLKKSLIENLIFGAVLTGLIEKKTTTDSFIRIFPQFLVIFKMLRKYGYTCKNWRKSQKTKLKTLWCIANLHTFPVNNNISLSPDSRAI